METILRGHRGRRIVRLLPVILFAVFLGVVYVMMANEPRRSTRTASPPPVAENSNETRAASLYYQRQLTYDQAYTTCKELGLEVLATQLQVPARPAAVAAAYSREELPAFRRAMRLGCQTALEGKPSAFRNPVDADRAAP